MVAFQVGLKRPRACVGNSQLTHPGLCGGQVCQDGGQALPFGTNAFRLTFKKCEQPEAWEAFAIEICWLAFWHWMEADEHTPWLDATLFGSEEMMTVLQPNLLPLRSDFPRAGYLPVSGLLALLIATLACCGGLFEGIFKAQHRKRHREAWHNIAKPQRQTETCLTDCLTRKENVSIFAMSSGLRCCWGCLDWSMCC